MLGFLKTTRSLPNISEEVRSLPKKPEVFRRRLSVTKAETALAFPSPSLRTHVNASSLSVLFTSKIRDREEGIVIYSFYTWFSFLSWVWVNIFLEVYQARWQQLTFFNQAWEIGPQAWAGLRSKFSTRRHETRAQGVRVGRYINLVLLGKNRKLKDQFMYYSLALAWKLNRLLNYIALLNKNNSVVSSVKLYSIIVSSPPSSY